MTLIKTNKLKIMNITTKKEEEILTYFEKLFNIKIRKKELYFEALTHSSFLNENRRWLFSHNERLEFLGDAVLQLCVSDFIFFKFPDYVEGVLTPLRSNLVNSLMLSKIAVSMGLEKYLFISKGERMSVDQFLNQLKETGFDETKIKCYVLADAVEALFGAVYLDQGFVVTKNAILEIIKPFVEEVIKKTNQKDWKSLLQEKMQELYKKAPTYKVIKSEGPAHNVFYTVAVLINNLEIGIGEGWSKKDAEEKAAENALTEARWK